MVAVEVAARKGRVEIVGMALKSVVVDPFFEQMISAARLLESYRGRLTLLLLHSSLLHRGKWDVAVTADWIDRMSPLKAAAELTTFFRAELDQAASMLGSIRVRSTSDLLVRSILSEVNIPQLGTAYHVTGLDLDHYSMQEAVCLLSRPASAHAAAEKVPA